MAITRTAQIDDDGSGTTGTIFNNAWKQEFYNQIDAALLGGSGITANVVTVTATGPVRNLGCGPASLVTVLLCLNPAELTITGLAFTTSPRPGDVVYLQARDNVVKLAHIHAGSTAGNQFVNLATSAPTPLGHSGSATYLFHSGYWVLQQHEQGVPIAIPFNAANYTGQGAITAGMVTQHDYYLKGQTCTGTIIVAAFPGNAASADFDVAGWPYTMTGPTRNTPGVGTINGPWGALMGSINNTYTRFGRFDFAPFPTGNQYVYWQGIWTIT